VSSPWEYLLFDRLLISDIELRLLKPFPQGVLAHKPAIRLTVNPEPLAPSGDLVMGGPEDQMAMYFDGLQNVFSFRDVSRMVVVAPEGLNISLHSHPESSRSSRYDLDQALGDRLVTAVLSRLPILWESPSFHGATLSFGDETIVLLGESGVGKSTLSQHLVRNHGAILNDDDTALLDWIDGRATPIPMGGAPRLRSDAAADLQLEGTTLAGFAGDKIALETKNLVEIPRLAPLGAIFEIIALPESLASSSGKSSGPLAEAIDPVRALPALWRYLFTTNLGKPQSVQRFTMAHSLARYPLTRISYTRGNNHPPEVAALIAAHIGGRK
jgi:hypothetical protein